MNLPQKDNSCTKFPFFKFKKSDEANVGHLVVFVNHMGYVLTQEQPLFVSVETQKFDTEEQYMNEVSKIMYEKAPYKDLMGRYSRRNIFFANGDIVDMYRYFTEPEVNCGYQYVIVMVMDVSKSDKLCGKLVHKQQYNSGLGKTVLRLPGLTNSVCSYQKFPDYGPEDESTGMLGEQMRYKLMRKKQLLTGKAIGAGLVTGLAAYGIYRLAQRDDAWENAKLLLESGRAIKNGDASAFTNILSQQIDKKRQKKRQEEEVGDKRLAWQNYQEEEEAEQTTRLAAWQDEKEEAEQTTRLAWQDEEEEEEEEDELWIS